MDVKKKKAVSNRERH